MDPLIIEKFQLIDYADTDKKMLELLGEDNTEEKYGGKLPNRTQNFFPPQF